jgi:hypothetical protein
MGLFKAGQNRLLASDLSCQPLTCTLAFVVVLYWWTCFIIGMLLRCIYVYMWLRARVTLLRVDAFIRIEYVGGEISKLYDGHRRRSCICIREQSITYNTWDCQTICVRNCLNWSDFRPIRSWDLVSISFSWGREEGRIMFYCLHI